LEATIRPKVKAGYYEKDSATSGKEKTPVKAATARKPPTVESFEGEEYQVKPEDWEKAEKTASFTFKSHEEKADQKKWEASQPPDWETAKGAAAETAKRLKKDYPASVKAGKEAVGISDRSEASKSSPEGAEDFYDTRTDWDWDSVKYYEGKAGDKAKKETVEALRKEGKEGASSTSKTSGSWETVKDMAAKANEKVKEGYFTAKAAVKESAGYDASKDLKEAKKARNKSKDDSNDDDYDYQKENSF
jgi:hypothetical protein